MKKELIKSVVEKLAIVMIGGLVVVVTDLYADFRNVESKDKQIDYFKDYKLSMDSVINANSKLSKQNNELTHQTFSNMREMIENDKKLTVEAIQIAEDSIITITPNQSDSIRNILLLE